MRLRVPKLSGSSFATLVVLALYLCSGGMAYADSLTQQDLYTLGINYFDLKDSSCADSTGTGSATTLNGSDNQEKVFNYFVNTAHLSAAAAAGIVGNAMQESGEKINPTTSQSQSASVPAAEMIAKGLLGSMPGGNAWGAFQWDPPGKVINPLKKAGKDPDDLGNQLDFLWKTLQSDPSYYKLNQLKAAKTPEEAADIFEAGFERAGSPQNSTRESNARAVYNKYGAAAPGGSSPSTDTGSVGACTSTTSPVNAGFQQTLLAYAWPDYKGQGWVQKMPAYASAIKKSEATGLYVGFDGIDCGAFMTTLMIYSGFDPTYNHSGKIDQGAGNTPVQWEWDKAHWQSLGSGSQIKVADLHQGDIAVNDHHTFVWAGTVPGFHAKIASASGGGNGDPTNRAPMADTAQAPTDGDFHWFRKK